MYIKCIRIGEEKKQVECAFYRACLHFPVILFPCVYICVCILFVHAFHMSYELLHVEFALVLVKGEKRDV